MEDEILEINGKRYRRSTLIQFGRDHDSSARKAKNGGIVASVFGLLIVVLFLATPALVETSWLFFFLFPLMLAFAFGGEVMVIITSIIVGFLLVLGIGLLIYSVIERKDEYYINIAKYYIEHEVKE